MIADAVDAAYSIGWALAAWIAVAAFVAIFTLLSLLGAVWALPATAWRALAGALAASRALKALGEVRAPQGPPEGHAGPRVPAWAHTKQEAA